MIGAMYYGIAVYNDYSFHSYGCLSVISPLPRGSSEGVAEDLIVYSSGKPLPLLGKEGMPNTDR